MLGIPTLFERHPKSRLVVDSYIPLSAAHFHQWEAMERPPGADMRVTVRRGEVVRVEVVRKPSEAQRSTGIIEPWYRDCADAGADHWIHEAVASTDFSVVPDGEWPGEAVGEKIMHNPLGIEGHKVFLSSLFPWRDTLVGAPIPPAIGRTPFEYDDLRFWLSQTSSLIAESDATPVDGVVWWWHDSPVAQIRARDFGKKISKPPNDLFV